MVVPQSEITGLIPPHDGGVGIGGSLSPWHA